MLVWFKLDLLYWLNKYTLSDANISPENCRRIHLFDNLFDFIYIFRLHYTSETRPELEPIKQCRLTNQATLSWKVSLSPWLFLRARFPWFVAGAWRPSRRLPSACVQGARSWSTAVEPARKRTGKMGHTKLNASTWRSTSPHQKFAWSPGVVTT